jgi:hypothetical protein
MTQQDIDIFLAVYGSDPPTLAAREVDLDTDRLVVAVKRLSSVYILKGQFADEDTLVESLAAIEEPSSQVTHEEYDLYQSNGERLEPVFARYLGTYTMRLAGDGVEGQEGQGGGNPESSNLLTPVPLQQDLAQPPVDQAAQEEPNQSPGTVNSVAQPEPGAIGPETQLATEPGGPSVGVPEHEVAFDEPIGDVNASVTDPESSL